MKLVNLAVLAVVFAVCFLLPASCQELEISSKPQADVVEQRLTSLEDRVDKLEEDEALESGENADLPVAWETIDRDVLRGYSISVIGGPYSVGQNVRVRYDTSGQQVLVGIFESYKAVSYKIVGASSSSTSLSSSGCRSGKTYAVYLGVQCGGMWCIRAQTTVTFSGGSSPPPSPNPPSPSPPSPPPPSGDATTWVNEHNKFRSQYGVSTRVQWSDKIANSARSWGQQLANQGCGFYHSSSPYGENLAKGYSSIQAVMGGWVTSEARCWSASNPNSCSGCVCGHFTQVLWKSTSYIGCATVRCSSGVPIYVCQYARPGNCNGYDYRRDSTPCGPFQP